MILPKSKANDAALYYETHGKGPYVLLIAGLGSDSSSWPGVIEKLSKRFKVVVFDNRGAGQSEVSGKPYTVRSMAGDAVRLFDHLKIKRAHILGHSMGGYIAQELAISYPERVDKLILESTAAISSERNNRLFLDFYKKLKRGKDLEAWIKGWAFWLFSPRTFKNKAFLEAFVKNGATYRYLQTAGGFKGQIDAIRSFDTRKRLGRIKAKTLVIEGEKDLLILPGEARALAKNISNSAFQSVKGAGHCVHIENTEAFVKFVAKFLN